MLLDRRVLLLCGGVGGARMAAGFAQVLPADKLMVAVNVGDDFEHLGLRISPDLDSVCYTLAGLHDEERGWGRKYETWSVMSAVEGLGGPAWFLLGDKDIAWHLIRTQALEEGWTLSRVTAELLRRARCASRVAPITEAKLRTVVRVDGREMPFQQWFVQERALPPVEGLRFEGAESASLSQPVRDFMAQGPFSVVLAPSNPYLSIDPILSVRGVREGIAGCGGAVLAVSPIVRGTSVKGPLARMLAQRGLPVTPVSIAKHYRDLIDGLFVDPADAHHAGGIRESRIDAFPAPLMIPDAAAQRALAATIVQRLVDWQR